MRKGYSKIYMAGCVFACLVAYAAAFSPAVYAESGAIVRCKGHGTVSFEGSGDISINGEGILMVSDNAIVAFTSASGATFDEDTGAPPECIETDSGYCIYVGVNGTTQVAGPNGKAEISGENITVSFAGANIGLTARGNGTLVLKGYGIYLYGKTIGRWAPDGAGTVISLKE